MTDRLKNLEEEPKKYRVNIVLLILLSILSVIQVALLNRFSTVGDKLTVLNRQIQNFNDQNSLLTEQIASASSMTTLSQEAQRLGLVKQSTLVSLDTPLPVAYSLQSSL